MSNKNKNEVMKESEEKKGWEIDRDTDHIIVSDKIHIEVWNTLDTNEEAGKIMKMVKALPVLLEALEEVMVFLGHIQPRVGEGAFDHIWSIVEEAQQKATS